MDINSHRKPVLVRCRVIDEESRIAVAMHYSLDRPEPLWLMVPVESLDQLLEVTRNDEEVATFIVTPEVRNDRSKELKEILKAESRVLSSENDDILIEGEPVLDAESL